jgi:hypothetical protein
MDLEKIREAYKERGLVLALGGGVSSGSGIPTWTALLERVAEVACHTDGRRMVARLRESGFTLPAIAAILEREYEAEAEFREVVRQALYRDFPLREVAGNPEDAAKLVRRTAETNSTLNAVAAFCALRQEDGTFARNPRVHAVVNFNLDALFNAFVQAKYAGRLGERKGLVLAVERATKASALDRISIYHPHGFLRFAAEGGAAEGPEDATDQLILTERQYFDFYDNPYSAFSSTIMFLLREHPWLFVGMSMLDENVRRLLHYSWKEHVQAMENDPEDSAEAPAPRHFALLASSGDEELDRHQRASLLPLGVDILWLESYDEIPESLRQIYQSTGDDWRAVSDAGWRD